MQLVLGRLAATQSAKPLTLSLLVDQPFFTDLVVPENFGRPGSAAGAAALIRKGTTDNVIRPRHIENNMVLSRL
jgi:hypothetical protein